RGGTYLIKGQYDKAISDYNKAIELNQRHAEAYNARGGAYLAKGQYDKAISDFSMAIELNRRYAEAYSNRGGAYALGKGQYDLAIADCTKAIELNPKDAGAYNNRGFAYYSKGKYDKAWEDVHKAESLGYQVELEFLKDLRKASGRQE
ncbi:MAG: tetratricopeptide repeat protein, partial [Syntrophobacterales bacterium]